MTVIKKKASKAEPGVRCHCDVCAVDVTATVRIRCAHPACTEYDLCVPCFTSGAQSGNHNCSTHSYHVIEQHSVPIFDPDWGADEELLLLEGAEIYGLGSWADIADHIGGGRDKDEVKQHYIDTYINSSKFPLPELCDPNDTGGLDKIPKEEFQAKKKRRIDAKKAALNASPLPPKQKPTTSGPSCHEVQGYMPGRLEFETEFDNDGEHAVAAMYFEPGDGINPVTGQLEPEVELKLIVMDIYNSKLTQRALRKRVLFEHGLLEYRKNQAIDKKRTKEERDLLNKSKPFARLMNKRDYEEFSEGLVREHTLRQAVSQLQEWRKNGIITFEGGANYELEKAQRSIALKNALGNMDRLSHRYSKATPPVEAPPPLGPLLTAAPDPSNPLSVLSGKNPGSSLSPTPGASASPSASSPAVQKKGPVSMVVGGPWQPLPLTAENTSDFHLLSPAEQQLCINLRIKPKPYLTIKEQLIKEALKQGGVLKKRATRELCSIDVNKVSRIHDFFVHSGWIARA
ncbi:hypothetical protein BDZ91DRAFT_186179 [Kalaharituber pfeilii]|nr:hypothetical protein BDZ91DRAFT_186179 [Kalaharituber pfeilii]